MTLLRTKSIDYIEREKISIMLSKIKILIILGKIKILIILSKIKYRLVVKRLYNLTIIINNFHHGAVTIKIHTCS